MQNFKGAVAVITGAASGIGLALAHHCAHEGMRVVLADIDADAVQRAANSVSGMGADVLAVPTDVSRVEDIQALADVTLKTFGAVHVLCNNAGVGIATPILGSTLADWQWALGVNLWGVIHGVRLFAPIMRSQACPCHIINTASIAGLISAPGLGIYRTTKHAVVAFSEALFHELAAQAPWVKVSVLCPGMVKTNIMHSAYRPGDIPATEQRDDNETERLTRVMSEAMAPEAIAELVFAAMRAEQFYILTHPERNGQIQKRFDAILQGRNP